MASTTELLQMDLYGLLGVERTATEKQIKKAYRQKALSCHPDKNPDNPKAAELFHKLSQALEVLTDAAARAAYDKLHAAKRQAEERNNKLDAERKKLKLDLEARERQAEAQKTEEFKNTRTLEEEIARLREEGSRQLEEEQRRVREQIQKEKERRNADADLSSAQQNTPKLKLKWKCKKEDDTNGGYSKEVLQRLLQKYGDILNLIISTKKKGCAVVEFADAKAAERAFKYEIGLPGNPIKIKWLEGQPESAAPATFENSAGTFTSSQTSVRNERDYESLVLMRMRQAAERQKLIQQMQQEDEDAA